MYGRKSYKRSGRKSYAVATRSKFSKPAFPKYPIYKQVTPYNTVYPFQRSVEYDVFLDLSSGFNARGLGMSIVWSLANMLVTAGDGVQYTPPVSGASELSTLFDQWRIDKVETHFLWSASNHQATSATAGSSTSANNIVMPIINVVTDFDDNAPTDNLQQYPQCRIMQLGTTNGPLQKHTVYKPGSTSVAEIIGAGVTAIGNVDRGKWHDCATTDIAHNAIKFAYTPFEPVGSFDFSVALVVGCLKIRSKIFYSMRNPR